MLDAEKYTAKDEISDEEHLDFEKLARDADITDREYISLITASIQAHDPTLLDCPTSTRPSYFYDRVRRAAIASNSLPILRYLVSYGISLRHFKPRDVVQNYKSTETLEFLLAHGWDMNWHGEDSDESPFLWCVAGDIDMVRWCLAHGASVTPSETRTEKEWQDKTGRKQCQGCKTVHRKRCGALLERVASSGSIATFEFLRKHGAPIGIRTLHMAVSSAAVGEHRQERIAMVKHLVDVVRLDVNALDWPAGCNEGRSSAWDFPLCYVPGDGYGWDTRSLTWALLNRGADPMPALVLAREFKDEEFVEEVRAWLQKEGEKEKRKGEEEKEVGWAQTCCVQ